MAALFSFSWGGGVSSLKGLFIDFVSSSPHLRAGLLLASLRDSDKSLPALRLKPPLPLLRLRRAGRRALIRIYSELQRAGLSG